MRSWSHFGFVHRPAFSLCTGTGAMCLFAPVLWRSSLWLDVVYGCVSVCVCRKLGTVLMLSVWNITALSLDCCVWSFSPIHKNAIPCRSPPGLMKLTAIHQSGRFKLQWRAGGGFKGSASNYHTQNGMRCLAVKTALTNPRIPQMFYYFFF